MTILDQTRKWTLKVKISEKLWTSAIADCEASVLDNAGSEAITHPQQVGYTPEGRCIIQINAENERPNQAGKTEHFFIGTPDNMAELILLRETQAPKGGGRGSILGYTRETDKPFRLLHKITYEISGRGTYTFTGLETHPRPIADTEPSRPIDDYQVLFGGPADRQRTIPFVPDQDALARARSGRGIEIETVKE